MRRKDREINDNDAICEIISSCHCCRLGFNDNGKVYIVPLNFGYSYQNGKFVLYFHGAQEGRKIDLILQNPSVGFELDTNYKLNGANIACDYSARFQSIIGTGTVACILGSEEKKAALCKIMKHNTGNSDWEFCDKMFDAICVFKLEVEELSCKEHI